MPVRIALARSAPAGSGHAGMAWRHCLPSDLAWFGCRGSERLARPPQRSCGSPSYVFPGRDGTRVQQSQDQCLLPLVVQSFTKLCRTSAEGRSATAVDRAECGQLRPLAAFFQPNSRCHGARLICVNVAANGRRRVIVDTAQHSRRRVRCVATCASLAPRPSPLTAVLK